MALDLPITAHTLDNGLRVVLNPDRSVPTVAVNLWVDVGSRHERAGLTGLAHLFEHLMFQGSEHVAEGEHMSVLQANGGRLNATTWLDRTTYFETVPTGALDLALWLEADRHSRLLPALTQENLDNQRDVVKEEKRQRNDNQPYGTAFHDVFATIFPQGHPYHHPTIGSMEDLDAATLEDVHAFYRAHYAPDRTVLTLVGDIDPQDALARVERYFEAATPLGERTRGPAEPLPPLAEPLRLERREDVPGDRLYLAFRLPPDTDPGFLPCALALDALAGLTLSRAQRRLVREEELATELMASSLGLVDGTSLGLLVLDVSEGVDPAVAEEALLEELRALATAGPTEAEMQAAVADTERSWLEALGTATTRADLISRYTLLHDDPQYVRTYLDRVAAVTPEQVREAAATWLRPESRATVAWLQDRSEEDAA